MIFPSQTSSFHPLILPGAFQGHRQRHLPGLRFGRHGPGRDAPMGAAGAGLAAWAVAGLWGLSHGAYGAFVTKKTSRIHSHEKRWNDMNVMIFGCGFFQISPSSTLRCVNLDTSWLFYTFVNLLWLVSTVAEVQGLALHDLHGKAGTGDGHDSTVEDGLPCRLTLRV